MHGEEPPPRHPVPLLRREGNMAALALPPPHSRARAPSTTGRGVLKPLLSYFQCSIHSNSDLYVPWALLLLSCPPGTLPEPVLSMPRPHPWPHVAGTHR